MDTTDKSGRVKFTFEVEINEPAMELLKLNMENMSEIFAHAAGNWREEMMKRRKEGRGMGMIGNMMQGGGK